MLELDEVEALILSERLNIKLKLFSTSRSQHAETLKRVTRALYPMGQVADEQDEKQLDESAFTSTCTRSRTSR